jgi:hypothetical protein
MKVLLLLLFLILAGCQGNPEWIPNVSANPSAVVVGEVSLKPGERTTLRGEALTIELISVSNDSRCPSEAVCVWQGNAEVKVKLTQGASPSASVQLNTAAMIDTSKTAQYPSQANYLSYTIRLTELQPRPKAGATLPQQSYVAKFIVSKEIP